MFMSRSLKTEALRMYSLRLVTLRNYFPFVSSYHRIMKNYILPKLFLNPPLCHITQLFSLRIIVSSYHEKIYLTQDFLNPPLCHIT